MVYLPALNMVREHLRDNLQSYYTNHPGEYVVVTLDSFNAIHEYFFKRKELFDEKIKQCSGYYISEEIPKMSHRFNVGNKTLEFRVNDYIVVCPNDNKTKLKGIGVIGGSNGYSEMARCPDCNYQVERKPSLELVKKLEDNSKNLFLELLFIFSLI